MASAGGYSSGVIEEILVSASKQDARAQFGTNPKGWTYYVPGRINPGSASGGGQPAANAPTYTEEVVVKGKASPKIPVAQLLPRTVETIATLLRGPLGNVVRAADLIVQIGQAISELSAELDENGQPAFNPEPPKKPIVMEEVVITAQRIQNGVVFSAEPRPLPVPEPAPVIHPVPGRPGTLPDQEPANDPDVEPDRPVIPEPNLPEPEEEPDYEPVYVPDLPPAVPVVPVPIYIPDAPFEPVPLPPQQPELPAPDPEPASPDDPGQTPEESPVTQSPPEIASPSEPVPEEIPEDANFFPPIVPDLDDDPADLPNGSIEVKPNPAGKLDIVIRVNPVPAPEAAAAESNTRRQDSKGRHNQMYRIMLKWITRTFGQVTEVLDLWEVLEWNIYVDGIPLGAYFDKREVLRAMAAGEVPYVVDFEGIIKDFIVMQATDLVIGKIGQMYAQAAVEANWYAGNRTGAPWVPSG